VRCSQGRQALKIFYHHQYCSRCRNGN